MSQQLIKKSDIEKAKKKAEFVKQTAEQVIKDFALFGIEVTFSGMVEWAYEELYEQLVPQLKHLFKSNTEKLFSILYQIDLKEKEYKVHTQETLDEMSRRLAHAILEREFQKILIRNYFKEKEP